MQRADLTDFLAGTSDRLVIIIQNDAYFIHQTDLLLVVTCQLAAASGGGIAVGFGEDFASQRSIDLWEENSNIFRRNSRGFGSCSSCAHCDS